MSPYRVMVKPARGWLQRGVPCHDPARWALPVFPVAPVTIILGLIITFPFRIGLYASSYRFKFSSGPGADGLHREMMASIL